MVPEWLHGMTVGAGGLLIAGAVVALTKPVRRIYHAPKRIDRLEFVAPVQLRATLALLKAVKAGKSNGDTDGAIAEIEAMLTDGIISRKEQG